MFERSDFKTNAEIQEEIIQKSSAFTKEMIEIYRHFGSSGPVTKSQIEFFRTFRPNKKGKNMDENYTDQADGLVDHQSGVDDAAGNVAPILAPADGVITDGPRDGEAVHEGEVIGFVQTEED